ncbi:hypothetical protein I7I53_07766 [Histoplasma capsulatum var. duboisii H88]|uniref:Uncharacterized protein n=1 Tax=Ajellomyces capsulatus (strain H88) TaxID=544711 RepID=A0A8A1LJN6_AJEC8|nr:hypothetical protein I7I53_07766 [Histoplasma capsulatum var. duboisii H88]
MASSLSFELRVCSSSNLFFLPPIFSSYSASLHILSMDRQGIKGSPPLPSQLLLSSAQQSTLPAYCAVLGDFLEKVSFQTYTSSKGLMTLYPHPSN